MRTPRRPWRIALSLLYAAALLCVSLTPASAPTGSPTGLLLRRWLLNLLHVPAYAGLTLLFTWAIADPRRRTWIPLLPACVLAVAVGVTTELLQKYVEGRCPTLLDALLNVLGCALAVWLVTHTRLFGRLTDRSESLAEETTG